MIKRMPPLPPKPALRQELLDRDGLCRASIRRAEEIEAIQSDLEASGAWIDALLVRLEAIKDPTRFKMIFLLHRYGRLCVCDLMNVLGVTSSAVSQHLRRLKDMKLVTGYRDKQTIFYTLSDSEFVAFMDHLSGFEHPVARLAVGQ